MPLPQNISLVAADCAYTGRTVRVMEHCLNQFAFKNAFLFTDQRLRLPPRMTRIPIPNLWNRRSYSEFMVYDLPLYTDLFGEHVLIVQHDGFIVNASAWEDAFLQFDYIGAPWGNGLVGNGGFSLRSRRFLLAQKEIQHHIVEADPEDQMLCATYRHLLEDQGIHFAPLEVARRFAVEGGPYEGSFGYHGMNVVGCSIQCAEVDLETLMFMARYAPSGCEKYVDEVCSIARQCDHVTEFGTAPGTLTTALLYARPRQLISYDLVEPKDLKLLYRAAEEVNCTFRFIRAGADSSSIEETDLLLIDFCQTYSQLTRQLERHAEKVRKFIVIPEGTVRSSDLSPRKKTVLSQAVGNFLQRNRDWTMDQPVAGLILLQRKESPLTLSGKR